MRDESQAPRNSRELAVRNQFFTPRYVVQFLVDNTLGRLWLEMHGEQTRLTTLCDYLVRSAGESVQPRPRKDPRDLRILDPACGSGHFLLYSFDLLLAIYEEAWSAEKPAPRSEATGHSLREDYPDLAELRQAAPRLIVEYNLHGVDIDPRCAQIAALALWLRAQRAWKDIGVAASDRPRIQRTHIVVAEPMPGNAALVEEFAARLDPPLLRDLFKKMVGESRLAGDLGALLRVEDGIDSELHRAREQYVRQSQTTGFLPGMELLQKQGSLDLSGIGDDDFFYEAEIRIFEALRAFAETATGEATVRRRLFVGDAAQGVALIDLVRKRFDVVLMNPPFGAGSLLAKKEFEKSYPRTKNDIYAAFVERGIGLLHPHGFLGAITSRTGFFLSSFQKWREEVVLKEAPPIVFADLGYGVLDSAMVEVAAYCLQKGSEVSGVKTIFLRALEAEDKASALCAAINSPEAARGRQRFEVDHESFAYISRSPFSYWVTPKALNCFKCFPLFESDGRIARITNPLGDNLRFVRAWWERDYRNLTCDHNDEKWVPLCKGGAFSPFYYDPHLIVRWSFRRSTYVGFIGTEHRPLEKPACVEHFFNAGITWPVRTGGLSFRIMPAGCIFASKGPAAFDYSGGPQSLLALTALVNSRVFVALVGLQLARTELAQSYEVGLIQTTPVPPIEISDRQYLATLSHKAWSLNRSLDTRREISHTFTLPALLQVEGEALASRAAQLFEQIRAVATELDSIRDEIDDRCYSLYGIDGADRRVISDGFDGVSDASGTADDANSSADDDGEDESDADTPIDAAVLTAELVSWAVGVAFGRFNVLLATRRLACPEEPDPFASLPLCSPAMLTADDGLPIASTPGGYPVSFPEDGILVDDRGHARDLTAAMRVVFDEVFGAKADAWWNDIGALLDPKGHDLRTWLTSSYFEHHVKRYSKSRRKAPILWQLAVPSCRYSVWLYAHRLTSDSFFQIQKDVVTPKLAHEDRQLTGLIQGAGPNPSATERKKIAEQEALVGELRSFLEEIKRVAPLWNPMLDDGVALTMAPLWRLVPQHKPWQKELKSKWDELTAGKYDWAHVAMHLWPERVVPKCATDRSLAIAHGLEEIFWAEADDGKWKPRPTPLRHLDELVSERTSIAVKAALKSLLEAPVASGAGSRARRRAEAAA